MASFNNTRNRAKFAAEVDLEATDILSVQFTQYKNNVVRWVHNKIIERTPIDTGLAKASWNVSLGSPDYTIAPVGRKFGTSWDASTAANHAKRTQRRLKAFTLLDVFISNGNTYIGLLENGRSQQQAPRGMVAITLAEARNLRSFGRGRVRS